MRITPGPVFSMQWTCSGGRWKQDPASSGIDSLPMWAKPFPFDDVADLVVGVAVVGRAARLDDADELGRVHAARVLVDEVAERALGVGAQLRLVVETDDHLARGAVHLLDRHRRRDDQQLLRAVVVDHVGLARAHVRGGVGAELVGLTLQLERALAGDGEEELVTAVLAPRQRPPRRVARDVLLEQLRAGVGAHDDLLEGGVSLGPAAGDVLLGDHERVPHCRNLTCSPVSCQPRQTASAKSRRVA